MQVSQQQQQQAGAANDAAVRMNSGGSGAGGIALPHPMVAGRQRERSDGEGKNAFGGKGDMIDRWRQSVMY